MIRVIYCLATQVTVATGLTGAAKGITKADCLVLGHTTLAGLDLVAAPKFAREGSD